MWVSAAKRRELDVLDKSSRGSSVHGGDVAAEPHSPPLARFRCSSAEVGAIEHQRVVPGSAIDHVELDLIARVGVLGGGVGWLFVVFHIRVVAFAEHATSLPRPESGSVMLSWPVRADQHVVAAAVRKSCGVVSGAAVRW